LAGQLPQDSWRELAGVSVNQCSQIDRSETPAKLPANLMLSIPEWNSLLVIDSGGITRAQHLYLLLNRFYRP
jgi:hypothetical protein